MQLVPPGNYNKQGNLRISVPREYNKLIEKFTRKYETHIFMWNVIFYQSLELFLALNFSVTYFTRLENEPTSRRKAFRNCNFNTP